MSENNNSSQGNQKIINMLAYVIFFIPLLAGDKSEAAKFHANQGFLIFLLGIVGAILGQIVLILSSLVSLVCFVLFIIGIMNANKGEQKELPVIGSITIIK